MLISVRSKVDQQGGPYLPTVSEVKYRVLKV